MAKLKIKDITINPNNPRRISESKLKQLINSIITFPEMLKLRPIVVNKTNMVLGGNMRLKALQKIEKINTEELLKIAATKDAKTFWKNWDHQVEVEVALNLTAAKEKEFIIKDNVAFGEWDQDLLIKDWDLNDLDYWGLETEKIKDAIPVELTEDIPPEPDAKNIITKKGQIIQLGNHRLMCGDAGSAADVKALFKNKIADLYLTDPPYNVNYSSPDGKTITNDNLRNDDFYKLLYEAFNIANKYCKKGASAYIFHASITYEIFIAAFTDAGFLNKQQLIWIKNSPTLGRQDYQWQHEPIIYGWKKGASHYFINNRCQRTTLKDLIPTDYSHFPKKKLLEILENILIKLTELESTIINEKKPTKSTDHPTMKPVKLVGYFIRNSSHEDDLIYDSFAGSGSVVIAAEQLKRKAYMMEKDPVYCDVIIKRYEAFTGKKVRVISN